MGDVMVIERRMLFAQMRINEAAGDLDMAPLSLDFLRNIFGRRSPPPNHDGGDPGITDQNVTALERRSRRERDRISFLADEYALITGRRIDNLGSGRTK